MNDTAALETQGRQLDSPTLDALIQRVARLDKPMRNASDKRQTSAALLTRLTMRANSHR